MKSILLMALLLNLGWSTSLSSFNKIALDPLKENYGISVNSVKIDGSNYYFNNDEITFDFTSAFINHPSSSVDEDIYFYLDEEVLLKGVLEIAKPYLKTSYYYQEDLLFQDSYIINSYLDKNHYLLDLTNFKSFTLKLDSGDHIFSLVHHYQAYEDGAYVSKIDEDTFNFFISNNKPEIKIYQDDKQIYSGSEVSKDVTLNYSGELYISQDNIIFTKQDSLTFSSFGRYYFYVIDIYQNKSSLYYLDYVEVISTPHFEDDKGNVIVEKITNKNVKLVFDEAYQCLENNNLYLGNYLLEGEHHLRVFTKSNQELDYDIEIDFTPPTCNYNLSKSSMVITGFSSPCTYQVYLEDNLLDYNLNDTLTEVGNYHLVFTDEAGNQSELNFTLTKTYNVFSTIFIIIVCLVGLIFLIRFITKHHHFKGA